MAFLINVLTILAAVISVLLIGLVLIQRGRGGGLAGAFGGAGGSSAFGTKAGDVFTRITIGVAAVWIVICMLLVVLTNRTSTTGRLRNLGGDRGSQSGSQLDDLDKEKGKDKDLDAGTKSKSNEPADEPAKGPASGLPPAITPDGADKEKSPAPAGGDTPKAP
ncbi:MAG: preprotein translocase subunit SecG [Isosphaeraceae bacterium]